MTAPVLLSQTTPHQVATAIQNRIFHNGYFQNTVAFDTVRVGHKKAKFRYSITLRQPYLFDSIVFPTPTVKDDLMQKISTLESGTLLKKGEIYTLGNVKNERVRIDRGLKENGFIYFNPDFISIRADSVTGDHQIKAEVTVKPETPPESRKAYTIRNIFIHDDHSLENTVADTMTFGRGSPPGPSETPLTLPVRASATVMSTSSIC